MWHKMANRYTTKKLHFYQVDCSMFPELAKDFKINLSVTAEQLPCLIMLENEKECLRFPPLDEKTGKSFRVVKYVERELIKYFDLDQRHLSNKGL